ncbi:glycosyltransferase [Patescibacteria group bacterium]|nr:glycosyltransferase [Patescibacteria group bacterium]MBU1122987.1 glycosyltransferase [Patescibacteria group bacterium]MBU1911673.1 glycosyltransferase [Patescibacteria group bacterium]
MNLAITADWLPIYAGAEHVIAELHTLWPKAPIYTTIANHGNLGPLDNADIRTSPLQKYYHMIGRRHRILLPFMLHAIENFDLSGYDVILSSSHAIGKGIIPPSTAKHICYCHTPIRYGWEMEEEYLSGSQIPKIFWKHIKKRLKQIRRWDMTTAKRVDVFIANSSTVAERIKKIYNREAEVIHPPVSERFFKVEVRNPESGIRTHGSGFRIPDSEYLALGRLVPYKRFDLLVETANKYNLPLLIAGTGPEESRLKSMAGPTVKFLGFVPDDELPSLYANSKALLFPQEEDAGITPLEAQACGTPVIAFGKGGARDTVRENMTGVYFSEQTTESLKDAIDRFEGMQFDSEEIRRHAEEFRAGKFREKVLKIVKQVNIE